ncbi:MAG: MotA/TolQ/ExbB proton channel family protein [Gammaproteobacteria bacterium]|nr:MotA/TolQ/ExbB proton channel family protein [Gammaproteobacteria bacterium]
MKKIMMQLSAVLSAFLLASTLSVSVVLPAQAQDEAKSLDELLSLVRKGKIRESREDRQRVARFMADKKQQASEVTKAKQTRTQEEQRSARLEKTFEANKEKIATKREALKQAKGELTELFGHINSTAGDMRENFNTSLTSIQFPNREQFLTDLIEKLKGDALPTIAEIEQVWFDLQREMIASGQVVEVSANVSTTGGEEEKRDIVRVGTYNAVTTDGQYLRYSDSKLSVLPRQPEKKYTEWAAQLASLDSGAARFGVDPTGPTGGSLLSAFINTPTLAERWHQGRQVGYVISAVGVFAILIAIWRFIVLGVTGMKVSSQLKSDGANSNNPLGRVLAVYEENPDLDTETLELKLNEAVLKEIPKLESSLTLIKIIAAVAPLLGLLGTVTGMIITFQSITIFGAGDPKTMAGGISSALVTTVLGLVVAIPTLLAHTVVNGRAKRIIHVIEEQAAGIIARNSEARH